MQLEFRDGIREVPDHLADMMRGLDTYRMTYEEAQIAANQRLVRDRLNQAGEKVIADHFRRFRIG